MNLPLASAIAVALLAGLATAASSRTPPATSLHAPASEAARTTAAPSPRPASTRAGMKAKLKLPYVLLDIEAPRYSPLLPLGTMFSSSGWPIVIRADASGNALGIATNALPPVFPAEHQTGYVVFADPDGCLELPFPFDSGGTPCAGLASDETYMEFTNDADQAGIPDEADKGNRGRRTALADPAQSGRPVFHSVGDPNVDYVLDPVDASVGPATGDDVDDGFGYGADDDFPGLVLLTPVGNGLVLDADFDRPAYKVQRNLAGFLQWVGYELSSATRNTVVRAGMIVPYGLVAPLMKTDDCIGGTAVTPACSEPARFRVDGGPSMQLPGATGPGPFTGNYPPVFEAPTYELRAFIVSGVAPSTLADINHDGIVSARDATLAGYDVISNEKVVRFHQLHGTFCGNVNAANVFFDDVDGNGRATDTIVCPAGPGQITRIPR
jgi:hypothetical protein